MLILRGDRRGKVRAGVRGDAARNRAPSRDQDDPPEPRRLLGVHPPLRGRGAPRRLASSTPHIVPVVRLLARAGRRLPRAPPAARWHGPRLGHLGRCLVGGQGEPAPRAGRRRGRSPPTRPGRATTTSRRTTCCSTTSATRYLSDFWIAVDTDAAEPGAGWGADVRGFGWLLWELLTGTPSAARFDLVDRFTIGRPDSVFEPRWPDVGCS